MKNKGQLWQIECHLPIKILIEMSIKSCVATISMDLLEVLLPYGKKPDLPDTCSDRVAG